MPQPTIVTWILVIFGVLVIFLPMVYAQVLMALRPSSQAAKDLLIGKGEDWRDKTHFRMSLGIAWADLVVWLPLLAAGGAGVLLGQVWGYALWAASGPFRCTSASSSGSRNATMSIPPTDCWPTMRSIGDSLCTGGSLWWSMPPWGLPVWSSKIAFHRMGGGV